MSLVKDFFFITISKFPISPSNNVPIYCYITNPNPKITWVVGLSLITWVYPMKSWEGGRVRGVKTSEVTVNKGRNTGTHG